MRQTVFKAPSEVIKLKKLFFEGDYEDQKRALSLCRAYETRYHLPVSVHLTALLMSAIHADIPVNDIYAIRLGYSAALIRMVNEILDSAQAGKNAAPLHSLAKQLDLPNSFVELRHAATHENIPSIYVLREMSKRALDWLFDKYWRVQDTKQEPSLPLDPKKVLSSWRRSRRTHVTASITSEELEIVSVLLRQYNSNSQAFLSVLFEKNILIPTDCTSSDYARKLEKSIALWGPAFIAMQGDFVAHLSIEISKDLNKQEWIPGTEASMRSNVLYLWLEYLIGHLESSQPTLFNQLMSLPRPWNAKGLAAYYTRFGNISASNKARKMAEFTNTQINIGEPLPQYAGKWQKVLNWTPRPIGT